MTPMMESGAVAPPDEDMYGESSESTTEDTSEKSEETASKSALLPSNMFDGTPEPGDTITVRVDHVFDSEIEVSLVSKPTETKTLRPTADEEIEAAATEVE